MFKNVGLIGKHGDERVIATLEKLIAYLEARDAHILFDAQSAQALPSFGLTVADRTALGQACDLVVIVGGDGTFLNAARSLVDHGVRLLGINLGRLGFLTDIMPEDMTEQLDEMFAGDFERDERFLLHTSVTRARESVFEMDALNEVVAHKWNIARLIEFETYIDGRLVNSQRSDGLIVATPTGSTAYSLSGGGPILHPTLNAVVLVPICPHTLSSRPIVVDARSRIEIVLGNGESSQAQLTCDGQMGTDLAAGDRIVIERNPNPLHLIHPKGHDYYATLRAKLHWGREL